MPSSQRLRGGEKVSNEIIKRLDEPVYLSITNQKGDKNRDGGSYYKNKIFIYRPSGNDKDTEPRATHEYDHMLVDKVPSILLYNDNFDSILNNSVKDLKSSVEFIEFINKYALSDENSSYKMASNADNAIEYLSDKHEIHARQMATRFWLSKYFSGYDVEVPFNQQQYYFLKQNKDTLPIQIQQLMDIFHRENDFIYIMQNY